jgi:hypothetical protein
VNGVDDLLAPYILAWREDSLQGAPPQRRERARAAMLAAVAGLPRGGHRALPFRARFRLRHAPLPLAGAVAALAAAVVAGLIGWNAPAGSPLHGVRVARQGLLLAVPGANLAELHLEFAEQSLSDAHNEVNAAASLADARSELDAARGELPVDHHSALWTRWSGDESLLGTEDAELRSDNSAAGGGSDHASPAVAPSRGGATPEATEAPGGSATRGGSSEPSQSPQASPSESPGGGDDNPPSSSASPHPE